jgi:putative ABC transport system permease protein
MEGGMGFFFEIVRLGIGNLRLHKLRSFLTSLGIILGVAAVILMVAIGEGNKQAALREIRQLGATNIIVRSTRPPESGSFGTQERSFIASFGATQEDLRRLQHFIGDSARIVALKAVGDEVSYRDKRMVSQAFGTTPDLIDIASMQVARGRYITESDLGNRNAVAVIGDQVARQFFPIEDPIGKEFRIAQRVFRIVGILRPVGLAGGAGSKLVGRDLNKDVHIPMSTARMDFGDIIQRRQSGSFSGEQVEIHEIYVTAPTTDDVAPTAAQVRRIMEAGHPDLLDVQVHVPWELLETARRTQRMWTVVLTAIAAISLLVGGIGIMNIMLATVTERTREIGIRRALGATRANIVLQFLIETGSLSTIGGLLGIGVGVGTAYGIGMLWPFLARMPRFSESIGNMVFEPQVTSWSIILSFVVAMVVGIGFGVYPAIVASRKDPIVALRHD